MTKLLIILFAASGLAYGQFSVPYDTGSGTNSAKTLRMVIATDQPNLTTALNVSLAANQSVNVAQFNGVTPLMGNGVSGTGSQRVNIASDNTAFTVNAAQSGAWSVSQSGTWTVQPGNTANTTAWLTTPVTATQSGTTTNYLASTASTNLTTVKASAGNVYLISAVNTTATLYYLRLYNASSLAACSTATGFLESIPIPASATGAGIVRSQSFGQAFSSGIIYCITGGSSSTDNSNAAAGVFVTLIYK